MSREGGRDRMILAGQKVRVPARGLIFIERDFNLPCFTTCHLFLVLALCNGTRKTPEPVSQMAFATAIFPSRYL